MRVLVVIIVVLLAGCRAAGKARFSSATPIILISIDTLRSDHLPAYGYRQVQTPNIDALAADSVVFERAYAHSPLTLPSHASMLTGVLPARHGLRDNTGYRMSAAVPTLAEVLKQRGYATGAAVSAFILGHGSGIARGFDFYEDAIEEGTMEQSFGLAQRPGTTAVQHAKQWISEQRQPFFFFLHLYEPHTPYDPPEPYRSRYAEAYDGEIAYADELVGEFLRYLKDSNLYEKTLIVLVSDHGEGLNDHGEAEHGIFVYRESIQVPLIIKLPGSKLRGKRSDAPVQLIDLLPTIIEATGGKAESVSDGARSLLSLYELPASRPIYGESYFPRLHFGWSDLHSLIEAQYHYIHAPSPELYRLDDDPAERRNRLAENRRTYVQMRKKLEPMIVAPQQPSDTDMETRSKLLALGYLSSTVPIGSEVNLPDPKTRVKSLHRISQALNAFHQKRYPEALALLNELLQENWRMPDIWETKARTLTKLHRKEEAIEAAKEGLRVAPWSLNLAVVIAGLSLELNRLEEAQKYGELALAATPAEAHAILSRVSLAKGDLNAAETHARESLRLKPRTPAVLLTLGEIEHARHNYEKALGYFDQAAETAAERRVSQLPSLKLFRGAALAQLGRLEEAERSFREEIRAFPDDPRGYQNLVLLLVMQKRLDEATQVIYQLIEAAPQANSYIAVVDVLNRIGDRVGAHLWARRGHQRFPSDPRLKRLTKG